MVKKNIYMNIINDFIQTRLKPYEIFINDKQQKQKEEIPGAKLNRPVKNPVLC